MRAVDKVGFVVNFTFFVPVDLDSLVIHERFVDTQ